MSASDIESRTLAQLRAFIRHAPLAIAMFDRDMNYLAASARWVKDYGLGHSDLLGRNHYEVYPALPERWKSIHRQALAGETIENDDEVWIHPDGTTRWLRWAVQPWTDERGAIGGIIISTDDVSALRESEHRYSAIFDNVPFAMALTRLPELTTVAVNDAFLRLFEYSKEEVVGRTSVDLGIADAASQARVRAELEANGSVRGFECTRHTKAGEQRKLSLTIDPVSIGPVQYVLTTIQDISDRHEAARARRETARVQDLYAKLHGIVSLAADAIVSVDAAQRIVLYNRGAETTFGWTAEEAIGRPLAMLLPERYRDVHHRHVERFGDGAATARRMGEPGSAVVGLRKNGEEFPAQAAISRVDVGEGRLYSVVLRDVTEQHTIEAEQRFLADVGRVLAATLDVDQMLAELAGVTLRELADVCLVDLLDARGEVRRVKVIPRDPSLAPVCDEVRRFALDRARPSLVTRVLQTGEPVFVPEMTPDEVDGFAQSDDHRRMLRQLAPRSVICVPLVAGVSVLGALALVRRPGSRPYRERERDLAVELGRRASLALDNTRLYETARRAIQMRDEVLGVVAHDLRSPLHQILLEAERLRHGGLDVGPIRDAGRHMARLIEDLLDVARLEAGQLAVKRDAVDLGELLRTSIASHRPLCAAASLELCDEVPDDLPVIAADRSRLLQILENLLGNAIKFTPAEGRITVGARRLSAEVELRISDTGRGIAADDLARIFDRFWQARRADRHGAGLGLAIVEAIVHAHGGEIRAESVPARGTTFIVTLPIGQPLATPASAPAAGVAPAPPGRRVLVVDDDRVACTALAALLAEEGYVVDTATGGVEALAKLETFGPAIALVDVVMPGMNGIELARRAREARPELRCVLMTGLDERNPTFQGTPALPYVSKPVELDRLLSMLATIASGSQAPRGRGGHGS